MYINLSVYLYLCLYVRRFRSYSIRTINEFLDTNVILILCLGKVRVSKDQKIPTGIVLLRGLNIIFLEIENKTWRVFVNLFKEKHHSSIYLSFVLPFCLYIFSILPKLCMTRIDISDGHNSCHFPGVWAATVKIRPGPFHGSWVLFGTFRSVEGEGCVGVICIPKYFQSFQFRQLRLEL